MPERKLPRWLRKGNVIYQVVLSTLAAVNTGLTLIDSQYADIPPMYFKVCAIGLSALPVIWSKFLDEMKKYGDERTPTPSVHESPALGAHVQSTSTLCNELRELAGETESQRSENSPALENEVNTQV